MNQSRFLQNISYSFGANILSLLVSVIMVIIVPKFLSLEAYGTWQLFLFYFSYIGFFHFGWIDGLYLRYAGKDYRKLDPKLFSGQLLGIFILQLIIASIIVFYSLYYVEISNKREVLMGLAILTPMVNLNNAYNQIMQFTNRIKDYAKLLSLERILLLLFVFVFIFLGYNSYTDLYFAKLISVTIVFLFSIFITKSLVTFSLYSPGSILKEAKLNIEAGSKLMFANIASMLIIGCIRYGISEGWDIETFGKVSLTLGISNFLLIFINALSVVFFPVIKRAEEKELVNLYIYIRTLLSVILLALLLLFYPLKEGLVWWLPQYEDSFIFMSALFPICIFEGRVQLLVNTYLKSLREETLMLKINLASVILGFFVTLLTVFILHNLLLTVFAIVFVYGFRCILSEVFLQKILNITLYKDFIIEMILILVFIISGTFFYSIYSALLYLLLYLVYILFNKSIVIELYNKLNKSI
ncbi:sugar transporter [Veillonella criceti]|uniref:Polysaccharide biosynthesis protein n=1 Tax=Veillonella criceti TaxID=103891 RepID=A0A380NMH1_9FIRM|nr:sugar transporter [Veillonella criceti]SUP44766.1 Polysaccharide biosynthesis protein [Veillonella criceti]